MEKKLLDLVGKSYRKDGQKFLVKGVEEKGQRINIQTDRKLIVINDFHLNGFLEGIEIIDEEKKVFIPNAGVITVKPHVYEAEIIEVNNRSEKMVDSLMSVFEEFNSKPSEELYKKAKAMSDVANTVVNVQMVQYKFLTLKK